jgi:hypothetical protein
MAELAKERDRNIQAWSLQLKTEKKKKKSKK